MSKALFSAATLLSIAFFARAMILPSQLKQVGKQSLNGTVIRFPLYLKFQSNPPIKQDPQSEDSEDPEPPIPKINYRWNFETSMSVAVFNKEINSSMVIDINYRNILVPIVYPPNRNEGVICEKDRETPRPLRTCLYNSSNPLRDTMEQDHWAMYGQQPTGFFGNSTWQWTLGVFEEGKRFNIGTLTTSPVGWLLQNSGILGMGSETSTTSLWSYLFEVYQPRDDYFYTSFYLNTNQILDIPVKKEFYWWQLFNPSYDDTMVYDFFNGSEFRISDELALILDDPAQSESQYWIPNLKAGNNSQTWGIRGVNVTSSDLKEPIASNINICFAMNSNATFLFPKKKLEEFKKNSLESVCRGAKCGPGSFLLNSAEITLAFNDVQGKPQKLTVTPGAYLYNNQSDYVQVAADYIEKYEGNGCDPTLNNQLGLGKMFFYNYQVVFRMSSEGKAAIGFFNYKTRPTFAHYAKVNTLVITGLVFVMFLFVCIMGLRWKGISEAGDEEDEGQEVHDDAAYKLAATVPTEDEVEEEKDE